MGQVRRALREPSQLFLRHRQRCGSEHRFVIHDAALARQLVVTVRRSGDEEGNNRNQRQPDEQRDGACASAPIEQLRINPREDYSGASYESVASWLRPIAQKNGMVSDCPLTVEFP